MWNTSQILFYLLWDYIVYFILDLGGSRLKRQQQACDDVLLQFNTTSKKFNSMKVALKSSEKAAKKVSTAIKSAEKYLEKSEALLEKKKAEFKALEGRRWRWWKRRKKWKRLNRKRNKNSKRCPKSVMIWRKINPRLNVTKSRSLLKIETSTISSECSTWYVFRYLTMKHFILM